MLLNDELLAHIFIGLEPESIPKKTKNSLKKLKKKPMQPVFKGFSRLFCPILPIK